jgi:glycosyltransferase involved in cell wall biosynthesis
VHVLFVHKSFAGQFGPFLARSLGRRGLRFTFATDDPAARAHAGLEIVRYRFPEERVRTAGTPVEPFERAHLRAEAVRRALAARPRIRPDLVVGHSGFGSTLYLRDLYDAPIVNYFEWYHTEGAGTLGGRPEFRPSESTHRAAEAARAVVLRDLEACDAGWSPTEWQRSLLPAASRDKIRAIHDGIETDVWRPAPPARRIAGRAIPPSAKVVTFVSRTLEMIRGFDVFVRVARRIARRRRDVLFVCVGTDDCIYGPDRRLHGGRTLVASLGRRGLLPPGRFLFPGWVGPEELRAILSRSDLHVHPTAPFFLSWSILDAMACGAPILASRTPVLSEVIRNGRDGLLRDLDDEAGLAEAALRLLARPAEARALGRSAVRRIRARYDVARTAPRLMRLFRETLRRSG